MLSNFTFLNGCQDSGAANEFGFRGHQKRGHSVSQQVFDSFALPEKKALQEGLCFREKNPADEGLMGKF